MGVESAAATRFVTSAPPERVPIQTLGQHDFLKLLVTQMRSQDPLNPQKDTDFIAQMAQFSSLEQVRNMQLELAHLRTDQQLMQGDALLGRTVDVAAGSDVIRGVVTAVFLESGVPKIVVNSQKYDLSAVRSFSPTVVSPK